MQVSGCLLNLPLNMCHVQLADILSHTSCISTVCAKGEGSRCGVACKWTGRACLGERDLPTNRKGGHEQGKMENKEGSSSVKVNLFVLNKASVITCFVQNKQVDFR
jgi:hypothetical protein